MWVDYFFDVEHDAILFIPIGRGALLAILSGWALLSLEITSTILSNLEFYAQCVLRISLTTQVTAIFRDFIRHVKRLWRHLADFIKIKLDPEYLRSNFEAKTEKLQTFYKRMKISINKTSK